jgi:hypothetical protein
MEWQQKPGTARSMSAGMELPAPELDELYPTMRVRQYMKKLQMFLMASPSERKRYDAAATVIQRAWGAWSEGRRRDELRALVCLKFS